MILGKDVVKLCWSIKNLHKVYLGEPQENNVFWVLTHKILRVGYGILRVDYG